MNTSSINEIYEHQKCQIHKSTLNPDIPKHRANNPFVNLIVGLWEKARERTCNPWTGCNKSSQRRRLIRLQYPHEPTFVSSSSTPLFIILVSQRPPTPISDLSFAFNNHFTRYVFRDHHLHLTFVSLPPLHTLSSWPETQPHHHLTPLLSGFFL